MVKFAKGNLITRTASAYVHLHHFVIQIQMEIVFNVFTMTFLETVTVLTPSLHVPAEYSKTASVCKHSLRHPVHRAQRQIAKALV